MKKWIISCLLLSVILIFGSASAGEGTTTLLVYLCGTDLQEDACEDLLEMAEVEAGEAINMVVLAGGANEWALEDLQAGSRTLAVIRDGYYEDLADWGYKSMGSSESLAEFLSWGMTSYPAERTIVVLWNHGAGSEGGVCFDETANDDSLTVSEINDALDSLEQAVPGSRINIFGCDACMMATYEMAAMLSRHPIDYFVASEELEPGTGWNYTGWLQALKDDPALSDEALCGHIIESYMEAGLANEPDDYLTLSAVDLSRIGDLESAMENFAVSMLDQVQGGNLSAVRRGRSRMYAFGSFADASWDMVDLDAVLDAYAQFDADAASEAKRSLSKAVVLSSQTDNLDSCCGLSILVPQDTAETLDEYIAGLHVADVIPNWIGFVSDYAGELNGGSYSCSITGTSQITSDTAFSGETFVSFSAFGGSLLWDEETESYGVEMDIEEYQIADGDQGFTVQLSQEDLENLDYVEGMLMMDLSEDDGQVAFIDFGTMQNNLINWSTGMVVSLYDGTWPVFGGQIVPLYDQTSNEHSRRSLIPVTLNGEYTYLVVVFPGGSTEGRVIGANAGYDDNGLPIRNTTKLRPGDRIQPVYTLYYEEEGQEDLQETEYLGEEIVWQDGMTVTYEDLSDEDEPVQMMFCFDFYDIFGEDTLSDIIAFEL